MAAKKITVLFLPQGARKRVRQFEISRALFVLLPLFLLSGAVLLATVIRDYLAIKENLPRMAHISKENKQQKEQLIDLAKEMEGIRESLHQLKSFDNKLRTMVNLETRDDHTQFLGVGGSDPALLDQGARGEKAQRRLVRLMHQTINHLKQEISLQHEEKLELSKYLEDQKSLLACTPSIWPTRGWVSSTFGKRVSPFTNEREFHAGLDISNRTNSPVLAPADGIVAESGSDYGYGRLLFINHGYGLKTMYAHLNKVLVKVGQRVKRGQEIAMVGSSGRTTGPHLHYEVHLNGVPVDPRRYILN